jgi:hypothetical protein
MDHVTVTVHGVDWRVHRETTTRAWVGICSELDLIVRAKHWDGMVEASRDAMDALFRAHAREEELNALQSLSWIRNRTTP